MKTCEVVLMHHGWHVTRRYCGRNMGAAFFPFGNETKPRKIKAARAAADAAKDAYVKAWIEE